ncbi:MAG: RNA methyltransferase [Ardenticatenaceae bacterium]|nr:RNA methyltransferase [Ardenticatenaceae bacterium]
MDQTITSASNPKLKRVRRLLRDGRFRKREKQFVVEGSRWISEMVQQGIAPHLWLATPTWADQNRQLIKELSRLVPPPIPVEENLIRETTATENPSGVVAVLPQPELAWPDHPTLLLILDGLRDPGNVGTLIRSAAAAGVEGLLIAPGTVDLFNPKVVRSSMGAILRLPYRPFAWPDLREFLGDCQPVAADAAGTLLYTQYNWRQPNALIIGNEAHGITPNARQAAEQLLAIPMVNDTESLNAAVAGAILLFEAVRQRTTR